MEERLKCKQIRVNGGEVRCEVEVDEKINTTENLGIIEQGRIPLRGRIRKVRNKGKKPKIIT